MQLLVMQFTIKMFHIGFTNVETCSSVKICEMIVHFLVIVQNNKMCWYIRIFSLVSRSLRGAVSFVHLAP
jgi:hypothetical protein